MTQWTLLKEHNFEKTGDFRVISDEGYTVFVDTAYYPSAPSLEDSELIVTAVNFYLRHLAEIEAQKQEDDE